MAAPLGSDPANQRLGWAIAHLPAREVRDRAPDPEGEERARRKK
jgi:hypothetical protein